mmetsp:Transcript_11493/g.34364  ORF Transcript_11493/g.34364 Transcript_11493/m.34364 type:complete len:378 (+) Transcript_11493:45-1178(+)
MAPKWVRVQSSKGAWYWRSVDGATSQWKTPEAMELLDLSARIRDRCFATLPGAVLLRELLPLLGALELGRFCATSRGGFALASRNELWCAHTVCWGREEENRLEGNLLRIFGQSPRRRTGESMRVDAAGREVYRQFYTPMLGRQSLRGPTSFARAVAGDEFLAQVVGEGVFLPRDVAQAAEGLWDAQQQALGGVTAQHGDRLSEWLRGFEERQRRHVTGTFAELVRHDEALRSSVRRRCPRLADEHTLKRINRLRVRGLTVDLQTVLEHSPADLAFAAQHVGDLQNHYVDVDVRDECSRNVFFRNIFGLSRVLKAAVAERHIALRHVLAMTDRAKRQFEKDFQRTTRITKLEKLKSNRFRTPAVTLHATDLSRSAWA